MANITDLLLGMGQRQGSGARNNGMAAALMNGYQPRSGPAGSNITVKPLKFNAARDLAAAESQKGGFGPIAAALLNMKANATDKYNMAAAQENAKAQALLERSRKLEDEQRGWDREDAVYSRARGDSLTDRLANWGREDETDARKRGYAVADRNSAQVFERAMQRAGFEHDNQKAAAHYKNEAEQNDLNRALKYYEQQSKNRQDMYQRGKDAGIAGQNLFEYGQNPEGFDVVAAKQKDPKLLNPISWFWGKPAAKAVAKQGGPAGYANANDDELIRGL